MEKQGNETGDQVVERTWKTLIFMKPHAVIPLVNDIFLKRLLQMVLYADYFLCFFVVRVIAANNLDVYYQMLM